MFLGQRRTNKLAVKSYMSIHAQGGKDHGGRVFECFRFPFASLRLCVFALKRSIPDQTQSSVERLEFHRRIKNRVAVFFSDCELIAVQSSTQRREGAKAQAERRRRVVKPAALVAMFSVLLLGSGCATNSTAVHSRAPKFTFGSLTNLTAYRLGTNLDLRFRLQGRDAEAQADWIEPQSGATNFAHRFAVLEPVKRQPAGPNPAVRRGNRVAVGDPAQWQQLARSIVHDFAPSQTNHCNLLLVENQEVAIFKDTNGEVGIVNLENKPPQLVVDRTYDDSDFTREAIRLLQARLAGADRNQSLLFATGDDPAFVFVDLNQRLMVFLSYPGEPETQGLDAPGWFTVRAINSLLVRSLLVAAIKNPVTLVGRGLWHLENSGATVIRAGTDVSSDPPPPLATGPGMDVAQWEKDLDHLVPARRYKGQINLLIDGEKYFPALIESVNAATRSVDMLVFIFDTDDYAVKIADLLKERSKSVHVRVLMDEMGSLFAGQQSPQTPGPADFQPPSDIISYLRSQSKVSVRAAANPWLTVDHRKCIIIDSREAFLGGMNIGREYRYEWHDMMVDLKGPVVARLERDYREAWAHAGPLGDYAYAWTWLFDRAITPRSAPPGSIDIRPLRTATARTEIYRAQLEAIKRARRYIYIENAYFDDDTIVRELIRARQRGVDVRVVLPSKNDSGIMQTSNQVEANDMIRSGIRVYAYPGMTHVKAAIYDGWACLGSANLEKMSLRVAQELDVAYSDPAAVDRLKKELFETDFRKSQELKTPLPLNWMDFVVKAFADQL
jgi:cardiolipin synthase